MNKVQMFITTRQAALQRQDWGVVKAMDAELARAGVAICEPPSQETAAVAAPERAVPQRKVPRPAKVEE